MPSYQLLVRVVTVLVLQTGAVDAFHRQAHGQLCSQLNFAFIRTNSKPGSITETEPLRKPSRKPSSSAFSTSPRNDSPLGGASPRPALNVGNEPSGSNRFCTVPFITAAEAEEEEEEGEVAAANVEDPAEDPSVAADGDEPVQPMSGDRNEAADWAAAAKADDDVEEADEEEPCRIVAAEADGTAKTLLLTAPSPSDDELSPRNGGDTDMGSMVSTVVTSLTSE